MPQIMQMEVFNLCFLNGVIKSPTEEQIGPSLDGF